MSWVTIRRETGLVEHLCEHGTGHPNWGSALWLAEAQVAEEKARGVKDSLSLLNHHSSWLVHGCDGCCKKSDFPGGRFKSLLHAHKLLREANEKVRLAEKDEAIMQSRADMLAAQVRDFVNLTAELPHLPQLIRTPVPLGDRERCFMEMAECYARACSQDPSTQTGCVIIGYNDAVVSMGANRLPFLTNPAEYGLGLFTDKPQKYLMLMHAERDAILAAARAGISVHGQTMYLPWFPCHDCAQEIIAAGLDRVVCVEPDYDSERAGADWRKSWRAAEALFVISPMVVDFVDYKGLE